MMRIATNKEKSEMKNNFSPVSNLPEFNRSTLSQACVVSAPGFFFSDSNSLPLEVLLHFLKPLSVMVGLLIWISSSIPSASAQVVSQVVGTASWYSSEACRFNPHKGCPTASGESLFLLEKNEIDFAAMWDVPFKSRVRVTNLSNGKAVTVTIRDRGPAHRLNRVIDLSKSAFQKIADPKQGIIKVKVEVLK